VSILALSREYPIVAPAEKGPLWHSTNFKLPSRRNEPHAQLISRLKSLLCNFLSDTSTRTPIHTPMATMSWQINCVFPFYFDAGFSRHLFLCAIFVAGVEWSYKLATFAVAICRFMRFSCGCRKAGNPEGRRDHLPKSSCLVSSWHLHHLRMRMRICYLSVCVCGCVRRLPFPASPILDSAALICCALSFLRAPHQPVTPSRPLPAFILFGI